MDIHMLKHHLVSKISSNDRPILYTDPIQRNSQRLAAVLHFRFHNQSKTEPATFSDLTCKSAQGGLPSIAETRRHSGAFRYQRIQFLDLFTSDSS